MRILLNLYFAKGTDNYRYKYRINNSLSDTERDKTRMPLVTIVIHLWKYSRNIRQDKIIPGVRLKKETYELRAFANDWVIILKNPLERIEILY